VSQTHPTPAILTRDKPPRPSRESQTNQEQAHQDIVKSHFGTPCVWLSEPRGEASTFARPKVETKLWDDQEVVGFLHLTVRRRVICDYRPRQPWAGVRIAIVMSDHVVRLPQNAQKDASRSVDLQTLLLATEEFEEFLTELSRLAAVAVQGDISCGITIRSEHGPMTVASSDERASQLDEVQYSQSEGPCLQSLREDMVVSVPDLAVEDRWPEYQPRALAQGVRSSLSTPLHNIDSKPVGALNLYAWAPAVFGPQERALAEGFAAEASRAMALARRQADRLALTRQLEAALVSRRVIDQAIGVIMAQNRCGPDDAFAILRGASQTRNVKLRLVAAEVVTSVSGEPVQPESDFRHPTS